MIFRMALSEREPKIDFHQDGFGAGHPKWHCIRPAHRPGGMGCQQISVCKGIALAERGQTTNFGRQWNTNPNR